MRILDQIKGKRTFQFLSIFLLSIVLSMAVILVAQQARATTPVYSVGVDTVNGVPVDTLPPNIGNPVELTGNGSAQPGAGLEKEYGIQIAWGDGSPYTIWRYSDLDNASPYLTWVPNGTDETYFTCYYSTNPGSVDDLGHVYATGGTYTITVKFFHGQPPGAESADASYSLNVHVLVPEISVSKSGPEYAHEGELINYTITVSNPSDDTTMYKVSVVDSLMDDLTANFSPILAPSTSETFTYAVPANSSDVLNTVTVTYQDLLNEQKTASASWTVTVLHPGISVSKSGPEYAHEGDVITYTITVSNPSSDTMYEVSVVDSLLGDLTANFSPILAPLTSESETFTYTVPPSTSSNISNTVTVTYEDASNLPNTASFSWTVTVLHPSISVSKFGPDYAHEDGVITYTINVSNTGDCPLYSVSVNDTLVGPIYSGDLTLGETKTFTVKYTAPTPSGDVSNTVTVSGSDILGLTVSDSASWFVKAQYQINVTASPSGAIGGTFTVTYTQGGTTYTDVQKTTPWADWVDSGTTVTLSNPQSLVGGSAGTRYEFDHYDPSISVVMTELETVTLVYNTQYHLTVNNGGHGAVSGEGWYYSGTSATISITPTLVTGGAGTRYVFARWSGASTSTKPSTTILMDGPKTATASWNTQYYLTVSSAYDTAGGEGWYDSGATAYATLANGVVPDGAGTRHVFTGWSGSASGTNPAHSNPIVMNGPKTATANWKTQYYLTLETSPPGVGSPSGAGWYDARTYASISATQYVDVVSGSSRYRFDSWTVSDLGEIGDPSAASTAVFMDGAKTVTANYVLQYLVTFDQTGLDETAIGTVATVEGSQKVYGDMPFNMWVDNGSVIAYSYEGSILSGVEGKRFRLDEVEGPVSPVTIAEAKTIAGRYVVQYKVSFAQAGLSSDAVGNVATVGAAAKTLHDLPLEIWIDAGSILNYSYKAIVSSAVSGKQYRLESVAGPSSPITVTAITTVTGNYRAQYYLTMNTNFGTVSPCSGWHDAGSMIQIDAFPPSVINGERYVWLGWSGSGSGSYSGVDSPASIAMNEPITEIAAWRHEYYLTVASIHGSPVPISDWFAAGTEISASISSELSGPTGTRYVCIGWAGTGSVSSTGTTTSTTFTINEPSSITWNWKTQCYLTMSTNMGTVSPGDGWHDEGSIVSISAASPQTVEGSGYVWHGWAGTGAVSYNGLDNPADITVNSPITEAAYWKILPELTIFVSNETIETCDRVAVHGTTAPVYSIVNVDITYTFPNGTQITRTVQTDEQGNYNDTLPLDGESLYGLFAQGGQWTITAKRSGDANREDTTGSTTLGIGAPGLFQINPIIPVLIVAAAVALSYLILHKKLNRKKSASWRLAVIMLAIAGLAFTVTSLVMNWMAIAGTATTEGQTYLVNIRLYPYSFGSVDITKMQYIGASVPSLIDSAWRNIPKSPGPLIALYSAPMGCILAVACLYKPKTQKRKIAKTIILIIAGLLILIPVIQSFLFVQAQASTTAGASTGFGIGQYIAMIGGLLIGLSSLFSARETPTSEKPATASQTPLL